MSPPLPALAVLRSPLPATECTSEQTHIRGVFYGACLSPNSRLTHERACEADCFLTFTTPPSQLPLQSSPSRWCGRQKNKGRCGKWALSHTVETVRNCTGNAPCRGCPEVFSAAQWCNVHVLQERSAMYKSASTGASPEAGGSLAVRPLPSTVHPWAVVISPDAPNDTKIEDAGSHHTSQPARWPTNL